MSVFKLKTTHWYIVRTVFLMAGLFTLFSGGMVLYTGKAAWALLAIFVAVMQIIFAYTGYCVSAILLEKMGVPKE